MYGTTKNGLPDTIQRVKKGGHKDQLLMFLSGKVGFRKSFTIFAAESYCHYFCQFILLPFEKSTIHMTVMTGSTAALLKGTTLYSATHFESTKQITNVDRNEWESV